MIVRGQVIKVDADLFLHILAALAGPILVGIAGRGGDAAPPTMALQALCRPRPLPAHCARCGPFCLTCTPVHRPEEEGGTALQEELARHCVVGQQVHGRCRGLARQRPHKQVGGLLGLAIMHWLVQGNDLQWRAEGCLCVLHRRFMA